MATSFLDASQVYGLNNDASKSLRLGTLGLLRTSKGVISTRDYLPVTFGTNKSDPCSLTNSSIKCFVAGDTRASENLGLSSMHTLFLREHNRIAQQLALISPQLNDNELFYQARSILVGVYQHIIYNEFVPATIGTYSIPDLAPKQYNTYFNGYDPTVNPSLANEFATATLRFGHSAVNRLMNRFDSKNNNLNSPTNVIDQIFVSDQAYE